MKTMHGELVFLAIGAITVFRAKRKKKTWEMAKKRGAWKPNSRLKKNGRRANRNNTRKLGQGGDTGEMGEVARGGNW